MMSPISTGKTGETGTTPPSIGRAGTNPWTECGAEHLSLYLIDENPRNDRKLLCTRPAGHIGKHVAVTRVQWL